MLFAGNSIHESVLQIVCSANHGSATFGLKKSLKNESYRYDGVVAAGIQGVVGCERSAIRCY